MRTTILLLPLLLGNLAAWADDRILIQAILDPTADVDEDVKRQCNIEEMVAKAVAGQVAKRNRSTTVIKDASEAGNTPFVRIRIVRGKEIEAAVMRRLNLSAELVVSGEVAKTAYFRDRTVVAEGGVWPVRRDGALSK